MKKNYLLTLCLVATFGCAAEAETETFRMLPVAAQAGDGEVLVGTYDEASGTLELVPAFVAEFEALDGEFTLIGADESQPLTRQGLWTGLGEGATLELAALDHDIAVVGGHLMIHAVDWTDGLTEAEAASAFMDCWDPEPCWWCEQQMQ